MNNLAAFTALFLNRRDDFALQRADGLYYRVGRAMTVRDVHAHLAGTQTIGVYLMNAQGFCTFAVFDADGENGLHILRGVQQRLALANIVSYLEQSRRGGHLWLFLAVPTLASRVRAWLLPFCPTDMEFYPKQDEGNGYGSLIRLPFGVHRRSGKRYPFVTWAHDEAVPVAPSLHASLAWLATVERVAVPDGITLAPTSMQPDTNNKKTSFSFSRPSCLSSAPTTIREWCAQQEPVSFIRQFVTLNSQGIGRCPFSWHHTGGGDAHASLKVYTPGTPGGYCWYCHTWQQGGSVFDFLRYSRNVDARTLWQELREGVHV